MKSNRLSSVLAIASIALPLSVASQEAVAITAYNVPAGTDGNQAFGGSLGTSFDVAHSVIVTKLGAFDDDSNGIAGATTLTTNLWNRITPTTPLATQTFTSGSPGTLNGAYRYKDIAPVILPFGFQGMIATGGYNGAEENGNQGSVNLGLTQNTGGGLLTFVQDNRFHGGGNPTAFPTNGDGGPTTRYLAGNFDFAPANIAYEVKAGLDGDQAFGGGLGLDFQVNQHTVITHLGVFDDDSNGIAPGSTITAQLYARNENGTPLNFGDDTGTLLAQVSFVAGDDGELIGGSRFKEIGEATFFNGFDGVLAGGTNATIVAFGYNAAEENGNVGTIGSRTTFDGFGQLTFEGLGRYGFTPGAFPNIVDGGPANRYAAGTFRFALLPEPGSLILLALGGVGLCRRRRLA